MRQARLEVREVPRQPLVLVERREERVLGRGKRRVHRRRCVRQRVEELLAAEYLGEVLLAVVGVAQCFI